MAREKLIELSPSEWFYRNRDLAGFSNPARALYTTVREFVENSLDACELYQILPDVYVRVSLTRPLSSSLGIFQVRVEDNGPGVPTSQIPDAFGKVLVGTKFLLRQSRGKFGLGGTMAILYGQISADSTAHIVSSRGGPWIDDFKLRIDIERNQPIVLSHRRYYNRHGWHGLAIGIELEGDGRALPRILEYIRQTSIANPHADLTFVDPYGVLYKFDRACNEAPRPPTMVKPHPYGIDVESFKRMVSSTACRTMLDFLMTHFHRVGRASAKRFLDYVGIDPERDPSELSPSDIFRITQAMKSFKHFRAPDVSCLSILSEEAIRSGIQREFKPEFLAVKTRKPSAYSGHPLVVTAALAYGGTIPAGKLLLFRFANRVPLLYDEGSDVAWKVIHDSIDWRSYRVNPERDPVAIFIYLYSTNIPFKMVGKECVADRPEIEREIIGAVRAVARQLRAFLWRRERRIRVERKLSLYLKYLPKIAKFSTELAGKEQEPDIKQLLSAYEEG